MNAYKLALFLHVGLGVAALVTYWIAALARKGSGPHKLAGKVYVAAMVGLLLPAIPLAARLFQKNAMFAWFLFYLLLITATAIWQGWYSIRRKRDFASYAGTPFRTLAWANIAAGLGVLTLGLANGQPILIGFSFVGVVGGRGMLKLAKNGPAHARWWMGEHLGAMLGCGIATHIAFLLLGLPRLLPAFSGPAMQTTAWLAPLAIAGLARVWLGRKYLPQPAPRPLADHAAGQPS